MRWENVSKYLWSEQLKQQKKRTRCIETGNYLFQKPFNNLVLGMWMQVNENGRNENMFVFGCAIGTIINMFVVNR